MKRKTPDPPTRAASEIKYVYPTTLWGDKAGDLTHERFIEHFYTSGSSTSARLRWEEFEQLKVPCAMAYTGNLLAPDLFLRNLIENALRRQPWLVKVSVIRCCMTKWSLGSLTALLETCPNIQSLEIRECDRPSSNSSLLDWDCFIRYIQDTKTLRRLVWTNNDMAEDTHAKLMKAIAANRSIIYLELDLHRNDGTPWSPELGLFAVVREPRAWLRKRGVWWDEMLQTNRTLQHLTFASPLLVEIITAMFEGPLRCHPCIRAADFVCRPADVYTNSFRETELIQAVLASHMRHVRLKDLRMRPSLDLRNWVTKMIEFRESAYKQATQGAALILHAHRTLDEGCTLDALPLEIICHIIHHLMNDIRPPLKFQY